MYKIGVSDELVDQLLLSTEKPTGLITDLELKYLLREVKQYRRLFSMMKEVMEAVSDS